MRIHLAHVCIYFVHPACCQLDAPDVPADYRRFILKLSKLKLREFWSIYVPEPHETTCLHLAWHKPLKIIIFRVQRWHFSIQSESPFRDVIRGRNDSGHKVGVCDWNSFFWCSQSDVMGENVCPKMIRDLDSIFSATSLSGTRPGVGNSRPQGVVSCGF